MVIILFDTDLYKSAFSTYFFKKQAFCHVFEFSVIFKDFYGICVIIIYTMYSVILLALN